jgi:hypothetical protein
MYIITARRITSGELLKYRKGFCIAASYGTPLLASSRFALTLPLLAFPRGKHDDQVDSVSQFLKWAWNDTHRSRVSTFGGEVIELEDASPY